jgi:hypothetical protein
MELGEEDTLIDVRQKKIICRKYNINIEGCIKKSIEEHELEGISYSSRFKKMQG